MIALVLASYLTLRAVMGLGPSDSLEAQRSCGGAPWTHAQLYAAPGIPYQQSRMFADGDTLDLYLSQSTAFDTRCAYRLRSWHDGLYSPWSNVAACVTSAPDTLYGLMNSEGDVLSNGWGSGPGKVCLHAGRDSTWRAVTQRQVQLRWWAEIVSACGFAK